MSRVPKNVSDFHAYQTNGVNTIVPTNAPGFSGFCSRAQRVCVAWATTDLSLSTQGDELVKKSNLEQICSVASPYCFGKMIISRHDLPKRAGLIRFLLTTRTVSSSEREASVACGMNTSHKRSRCMRSAASPDLLSHRFPYPVNAEEHARKRPEKSALSNAVLTGVRRPRATVSRPRQPV